MIDGNKTAKKAMDCFKNHDSKNGQRLLREFLDEVAESSEDHCVCSAKCRYHGKCFECLTIHRGHADHLPECLRSMVNSKIKEISALTEHSFDAPGEKQNLGY